MKETEAQYMTIQAVRAHEGAAHKMSNRFLVGVADLLIKLPNAPPMLLEAKINKFSIKTGPSHRFTLDLTAPQVEFLNDYHEAGMHCGVLSFVQHGRVLLMRTFRLDAMVATRYTAAIADHVDIGHNPTRRQALIVMLLRQGFNVR